MEEPRTLEGPVNKRRATLDLTGPAALRPFVVAGLVDAGRTVLVVTATAREAEDLAAELADLLDPDAVALLPELGDAAARAAQPPQRHRRPPARGAAPAAPPRQRRRQRPAAGRRRAGALACSSRRSRGSATSSRSSWRRATTAPLEDVVRRLADAAYTRVDLVEKRGEFAVRGGIVDVFPPTEEHPLRVEFWGDEVEEIRTLRGRRPAHPRAGRPARGRRRAASCCSPTRYAAAAAALGAGRTRSCSSSPTRSPPGIAVEGMESLAPVLVDEMELLVDLLPADTHVLRARPGAGPHPRARPGRDQRGVPRAPAGRPPPAAAQAPIDLGAASYRALGDVRAHALGRGQAWWTMSPFGIGRRRGRRWRRAATWLPCPSRALARPAGRGLPRRHRAGRRRHPRAGCADGLPRGRRAARPRPGRSAWSRCSASTTCAARLVERRRDRPTAERRGHGDLRRARARLRRRRPPAWSCSPASDLTGQRASTRDMRRDAGPPQAADRPARADGRRLRRARAARRRPVRRDEAARGRRRDPRVPRPRVRRLQARRPARPALRPDGLARPGDPLRRRRAAQPGPARRRATGPSARAGPARRSARSPPS